VVVESARAPLRVVRIVFSSFEVRVKIFFYYLLEYAEFVYLACDNTDMRGMWVVHQMPASMDCVVYTFTILEKRSGKLGAEAAQLCQYDMVRVCIGAVASH
jgi:hypothetical protein